MDVGAAPAEPGLITTVIVGWVGGGHREGRWGNGEGNGEGEKVAKQDQIDV